MDRREFFRLSFGALVATKLRIPAAPQIPKELLRGRFAIVYELYDNDDLDKMFAALISESERRLREAAKRVRSMGPVIYREEGG